MAKSFLNFISFSLLFIAVISADAMRDLTTMEITKEMGIGINLGNTFEAFGCGDGDPSKYYTCWGSPEITQNIIQGYYNEGYRVLRVPVHWFNMMDSNFNLGKDYIAAVKKVVDWAIQAGLYVIVNIHHDENDFFKNFPTNTEQSLENYKKIWTQIAEAFRDYNDYLMLEALNEEACWNNVDKSKAFNILNQVNQLFVDTVRASGGNNAERHLLLSGYCTDITETCNGNFKMPNDPVNRCAVSVHYYTPATFTILSEDADWGKAASTWGTDAEVKELNTLMDKMKSSFIDKGIPVIIGEYGCSKVNKDWNSVYKYLNLVCKACYDRGMTPILWDTPSEGYYDRAKGTFKKEISDAVLNVK